MSWRSLGKTRWLLAFSLTACGSSPDPKTTSDAVVLDTPIEQAEAAGVRPETGVPNRCVMRMNACMPPIDWAERLCGDVYEDLALYMFREGTPWTRFYMRKGLNAVNGWGPTLHENMLAREEVIVINHRLRRDSLQVEGSGGTYDVLRYNGSCVTLDVNEVTPRKPHGPRNSNIDWWALSGDMRDALMANPEVAEHFEIHKKACKGASVGRASNDCEKVDKKFKQVVAEAVRTSPELPHPAEVP